MVFYCYALAPALCILGLIGVHAQADNYNMTLLQEVRIAPHCLAYLPRLECGSNM